MGMKMAKASEADINMAVTLANYCDSISRGHMPDALSNDKERTEWLDSDDREQFWRLLHGLQELLDQGSICRVVWGMAVMCDPRNQLIDPAADTIEHHPKRIQAEKHRDDLLEALQKCKFDSLNMSLQDLEFCRSTIARTRKEMGKCYYAPDGTLMNADGTRSIFDDVDE